jgi:hypothetical protein
MPHCPPRGHRARMAVRRDGACSRNGGGLPVADGRGGLPCQRRRRADFPRASKGVTLLRIIRFAS